MHSKIAFFAKSFQRMGLESYAKFLGRLGVGADLTVRPKGFVAPTDIEDGLPRAAEILRRNGSIILTLATGITHGSDPAAEPTFRRMRDLGITTCWIGGGGTVTGGFGTVKPRRRECYENWSSVADLAAKYEVRATVHNHSGDYMEADVSMVAEIINKIGCPYFGINWDAGHAVIEGSRSVWKHALELCGDKIFMVSVKDYALCRIPKRSQYQRPWDFEIVPLGQGVTPWGEVFDCLRGLGFSGPISLHGEYEMLGVPELLEQSERDLRFLKPLVDSVTAGPSASL